MPRTTSLALAAPNPFHGRTALAFDLAQRARVEMSLFSVDGRHVRTLVDEFRAPGHYAAIWDGSDDGGQSLPPGVYYLRFAAGPKRFTRTVVLLR